MFQKTFHFSAKTMFPPAPKIMVMVAEKRGYKREDIEQHLGEDVVIYSGCYVSPCKKIQYPEAFACHHHYFGRDQHVERTIGQ